MLEGPRLTLAVADPPLELQRVEQPGHGVLRASPEEVRARLQAEDLGLAAGITEPPPPCASLLQQPVARGQVTGPPGGLTLPGQRGRRQLVSSHGLGLLGDGPEDGERVVGTPERGQDLAMLERHLQVLGQVARRQRARLAEPSLRVLQRVTPARLAPRVRQHIEGPLGQAGVGVVELVAERSRQPEVVREEAHHLVAVLPRVVLERGRGPALRLDQREAGHARVLDEPQYRTVDRPRLGPG